MSSGGYRANSGRKRGSKDIRPRGTPNRIGSPEAAQRKKLLSLGEKAKVKYFADTMKRIAAGEKLTLTEMKYLDKLEEVLNPKPLDLFDIPNGIDPLDYLLQVMRDQKTDQETRLRAASLAAPYCHPRKGEGAGKKDEKADRAKQAGSGKFKAGAAPLKLVGK